MARAAGRERRFPQSCRMYRKERPRRAGIPGRDDGDLARLREERANHRDAVAVRAEHGEGVAVLSRHDGLDGFGAEAHDFIVPGRADDATNRGVLRSAGPRPMPRLDRLPQILRNTLLAFPAQVNETSPFVRLRQPLSACRVGLVTTAGLHVRGDRPFGPGDQTYRAIPSGTPAADIAQSQTSIGFDRVPIMRDLNVSLPIDRLRELAARRVIGAVAPACYSFMGAQRDVTRIESETGPEAAQRLRGDGVDVVLVTPT